jgi:hypothetical protein
MLILHPMADTFDLPVEWNGRESTYPAELLRYGYTHKIHITVEDIILVFEPDEEGQYRAIVPPDTYIDKALLAAISEALAYLFGD